MRSKFSSSLKSWTASSTVHESYPMSWFTILCKSCRAPKLIVLLIGNVCNRLIYSQLKAKYFKICWLRLKKMAWRSKAFNPKDPSLKKIYFLPWRKSPLWPYRNNCNPNYHNNCTKDSSVTLKAIWFNLLTLWKTTWVQRSYPVYWNTCICGYSIIVIRTKSDLRSMNYNINPEWLHSMTIIAFELLGNFELNLNNPLKNLIENLL
jgi:hypothetical protein